MNNRLLLIKSVSVLLFCAFIVTSSYAQSGTNEPSKQVLEQRELQKEQQNQAVYGNQPDGISISEAKTNQSGINAGNTNGTVSPENTGITDPPASFYNQLEVRVDQLEQDLQGLDPQSQEYININRKLQSIKEILENK